MGDHCVNWLVNVMELVKAGLQSPACNLTNAAIASVAIGLVVGTNELIIDAHGLCLKNSWNDQSGHQRCEGCEKAISFPAPEVEIWI